MIDIKQRLLLPEHMRPENAGRREELLYQRVIRRADLRANRSTVYVFGDNVQRQGSGGQAREMRGEPNALGIATKWNPGREDTDYFDDVDPRCAIILMRDIGTLFAAIGTRRVVLPYDGIGTGLSRMPEKAPRLYGVLVRIMRTVGDCPWPLDYAEMAEEGPKDFLSDGEKEDRADLDTYDFKDPSK